MIYIVHGDDYSKSRKLIINQSNKVDVDHINEKDITEITPKELYETVASVDLFGKPTFVVLKIPNTKVSEYEDYLKVLKKTPEKTVLIILSPQKLSKTNEFLKAAKELKAKVVFNEKEVQSNIFDFVDNLFFKNRRQTYTELEKLLSEDAEPFYIFSMILYGLRNITHAKFDTEEFTKKSAFTRDKAKRQADNFSSNDLLKLYKQFYDIDKGVKTGKIGKDIFLSYAIEKVLSV